MVEKEYMRTVDTKFPEQKSDYREQNRPGTIGILRNNNGRETVDSGCTGYPNGLEVSKMRKLAQHYLNGLRISAFFIRHGFNRMKVKYFVSIYENWVYPFLYHG